MPTLHSPSAQQRLWLFLQEAVPLSSQGRGTCGLPGQERFLLLAGTWGPSRGPLLTVPGLLSLLNVAATPTPLWNYLCFVCGSFPYWDGRPMGAEAVNLQKGRDEE